MPDNTSSGSGFIPGNISVGQDFGLFGYSVSPDGVNYSGYWDPTGVGATVFEISR